MAGAAKSNQSYFERHANDLDLGAAPGGDLALRECQLGAYWATWAHFTSTDEPALVSLPTGSGKTALMMILAFGLKAKRCLVVTPSELLRDQLAKNFKSLDDLKSIGALPKSVPPVAVKSNDTVLSSAEDWNALSQFDVVVATPKTVSPAEPGVTKPPSGLFDVIFIDEGHHEAAPTYRAIVQSFEKARRILLTGTPYRRDRRALGAPLIYHYPIGRAVDAGIYEPVEYVPVTTSQKTRAGRDNDICKVAVRVFRRERAKGHKSLLLIRTDTIDHAELLETLYSDAGLKIKRVDYDQDFEHNVETLNKLRTGKLDGAVCIGMMGEGIDIPDLKIAALHAPPRSLPLTVQIVGRLARKTSGTKAFLVASERDARGAIATLYRDGADWVQLLPKLAKEAIDEQSQLVAVSSNTLYGADNLDLNLIRPFFSVRVFDANKGEPDYTTSIIFRDQGITIAANFTANSGARVFLMEVSAAPTWARDSGLIESRLELTLFYRKSGYLFELSTSERLGRDIRAAVFGDLNVPKSETIVKASGPLVLDYYTIGLRNALGNNNSQPSYKMLMGSQAQTALQAVDSLAFTGGHAIMRVDSNEVRGLALDSRRVWSMKRGTLDQFTRWCDSVARDLGSNQTSETLPNIDIVAPKTAPIIEERPVAVVLDTSLLSADITIQVTEVGQEEREVEFVPFARIDEFSPADKVLKCTIVVGDTDDDAIRVERSADGAWTCVGPRNANIRIESSERNWFSGDMTDFLKAFPPTIVLASGGVVRGDQWLHARQTPQLALSGEMTPDIPWTDCDVQIEKIDPIHNRFPKKNKITVQEYTKRKLLQDYPNATLLFDDGAGEIADFVLIDDIKKLIAFYHCKASGEKEAGTRVGDAYEVFGQACRSALWLRRGDLLTQLKRQVKERKASHFVQGTITENQAKTFRSAQWTYRVVIVQPGFDLNQLGRNKKMAPLLSSVYDYLLPAGAELEIWGRRKTIKPAGRKRK